MTNAQIILNQSIALMEQGIIKGSGQFVTVEDQDGNRKQLELPEEIHTFATWKASGRQVKRASTQRRLS